MAMVAWVAYLRTWPNGPTTEWLTWLISEWESSNPCAGPRRGLTSCFRSAALSSTVNRQIAFESGFPDFAKIRVRSSVLCDWRPQVCSGSPVKPSPQPLPRTQMK
jgi:hypothetical protein